MITEKEFDAYLLFQNRSKAVEALKGAPRKILIYAFHKMLRRDYRIATEIAKIGVPRSEIEKAVLDNTTWGVTYITELIALAGEKTTTEVIRRLLDNGDFSGVCMLNEQLKRTPTKVEELALTLIPPRCHTGGWKNKKKPIHSFRIFPKDLTKINKWAEKHRKTCQHSKSRAFEWTRNRLRFSFEPSGPTRLVVSCPCGEEFDYTY